MKIHIARIIANNGEEGAAENLITIRKRIIGWSVTRLLLIGENVGN